MPYANEDVAKLCRRNYNRTVRHGNWRQIYVDCQGMCQYSENGNDICGETRSLEFHEIFGEDKKQEGKMQQRILLCEYHHSLFEGHDLVKNRYYPSMLSEDVSLEVLLCGGWKKWLEKYNLIERK